MKILVTGGAGYIGSHTVVQLLNRGDEVVIVDNLSNSKAGVIDRIETITGKRPTLIVGDLVDKAFTDKVIAEVMADATIHFAGLKAVGESVQKPLWYYSNNLISTLNLVGAMRANGLNNLVFSSSATVYGTPKSVPITEDFPLSTTNPYGATKLMIEDMLRDICKADPTFNVALLRYFNPVGAHESGLIGEDPKGIPNNLLPYITQVAIGKLARLNVFGDDYPTPDGTGVRDYIHVEDLANGHLKAIDKLVTNPGLVTYNLGTGHGYSVLDMLNAMKKASGRDIPYVVAPRRAGDVAECYADPKKAREELGWEAKYDVERMCIDSWRWQSNNPDGYAD
ncbi:MAG: UDP-glucose 4-epimerase GalE [Clostridia bacterium]|nr:UDP-glucose 4-epimerase GalE [Clostridia bacterium]